MKPILDALAISIVQTASTSWYRSLGNRVFLNEAPPDAQLPLCVYRVASHQIDRTFDAARETIQLEFTEFFPHTSGASNAMASSAKLFGLVDGLQLQPVGYDRTVFRVDSLGVPEMEDDAIRTLTIVRGFGVRK
jgi:hypothetical protein